MMRLAPGPAEIVDNVPTGRLALEGNRVVPLHGELVHGRKRALWNGSAVMTVVLNEAGKLAAEPMLTTTGVLEEGDTELEEQVIEAARAALDDIPDGEPDEVVGEVVRIAVRRFFRERLDKKPVTQIHLLRV